MMLSDVRETAQGAAGYVLSGVPDESMGRRRHERVDELRVLAAVARQAVEALAKTAGVHRVYVAQIEGQTKVPSLATLGDWRRRSA